MLCIVVLPNLWRLRSCKPSGPQNVVSQCRRCGLSDEQVIKLVKAISQAPEDHDRDLLLQTLHEKFAIATDNECRACAEKIVEAAAE